MKGTRATQTWGSCHGLAAEARRLEAASYTPCDCPGCKDPRWLPRIALRHGSTEGPRADPDAYTGFVDSHEGSLSGRDYQMRARTADEMIRLAQAWAAARASGEAGIPTLRGV